MHNDQTMRPVEILLVEDNPADARLTMEGLKDAKIACNLSTVADGDAAMDFLRHRDEHETAPSPDLVLLDLNLPGKDGRDVLKEIKGDDKLRMIPVVVLTSSEAETDLIKAYSEHANCFISKPVDFEGFAAVIRSIENFWFTVVRLPPRPA